MEVTDTLERCHKTLSDKANGITTDDISSDDDDVIEYETKEEAPVVPITILNLHNGKCVHM